MFVVRNCFRGSLDVVSKGTSPKIAVPWPSVKEKEAF